MDAEARRRATLIAALRRAVDRREFRLVFQPRMSLADGRVCGFEALLRWQSEELGAVSPVEFWVRSVPSSSSRLPKKQV